MLPGGWRRGGPTVAKENALPGQGRGGVESNGGPTGPRATRAARARGKRWSAGVRLQGVGRLAGAGEGPMRLLRSRLAGEKGCSLWLYLGDL